MKAQFVFIITLFTAVTALADYTAYNCQLAKSSSPRHGATLVSVTYTEPFNARMVVSFFQTTSTGKYQLMGVPAVYAHSANIHSGRFEGFKKFTPSTRSEPPVYASEKFPEIAFKENAARTSASLSFPNSKNAHYVCKSL